MGQPWPLILITTSHDPAEQSRTFSRVLKHILPNSFILNRGNHSLDSVVAIAEKENCNFVYIIQSKTNRLHQLKIYRIENSQLVQNPQRLKFYQYIDHKIFGFHKLPERGPLSTSLDTRKINKGLMDFFQEYLFIEYNTKKPLWLAIDGYSGKKRSFISFIDALSQNKFLYAEVELMSDFK